MAPYISQRMSNDKESDIWDSLSVVGPIGLAVAPISSSGVMLSRDCWIFRPLLVAVNLLAAEGGAREPIAPPGPPGTYS